MLVSRWRRTPPTAGSRAAPTPRSERARPGVGATAFVLAPSADRAIAMATNVTPRGCGASRNRASRRSGSGHRCQCSFHADRAVSPGPTTGLESSALGRQAHRAAVEPAQPVGDRRAARDDRRNALRMLTLGVGVERRAGLLYSCGRRSGWRSPCGATCTGVGSLKHRTEVHRDV
jgi:hypothetical protein